MEKRFYGMQNDYMFRAVLQKSRPALKSLLCALLHLDEVEIVSVEIMNPIELGETIDGKTCMLDVKVELNKNKVINIELQIQRQSFWPERSLLYWARCFNELERWRWRMKIRKKISCSGPE